MADAGPNRHTPKTLLGSALAQDNLCEVGSPTLHGVILAPCTRSFGEIVSSARTGKYNR